MKWKFTHWLTHRPSPLWTWRGPYLVSRVLPHLRGERRWVSCHSSSSLIGGCPSSAEVIKYTEDRIQLAGLYSLFYADFLNYFCLEYTLRKKKNPTVDQKSSSVSNIFQAFDMIIIRLCQKNWKSLDFWIEDVYHWTNQGFGKRNWITDWLTDWQNETMSKVILAKNKKPGLVPACCFLVWEKAWLT